MADHPSPGGAVSRGAATSNIAKIADGIDRFLVLFESTVIAILLVALVIAVLVQVLSRYVINVSNPWTEESARYFFVWVSMMGAALGVQRHSHFGFDAVVRSLPPLGRKAAGIAALAVTFAMAGLIAMQGWKLMELGESEIGAGTNVPLPWVYAAIPAGGILIMLHIVLSLLKKEPQEGGGNGGHTC